MIMKFHQPLTFLEICKEELARLKKEADLERSHSYITALLNQYVSRVDSCNCPSVFRHTQACADSTSGGK